MIIIGITGLSCSGKTTMSQKLVNSLGKDKCLLISMDDYYKPLSKEQSDLLFNDEAAINFDQPDAMDYDLLQLHLTHIIEQKQIVNLQKYNLGSMEITSYFKVHPDHSYEFIVLEGCFIFNSNKVKELCDVKLWVETNDYLCALRRFTKYNRDMTPVYSPEFIINQCVKHVIPGQNKYIKPVKSECDLFLNGEKDDDLQIEMIKHFIKMKQKG
jgi:uridine kinase